MSKEKLKCKRCKHKISIEKYRSLEYPYCRSCERALNGGNLPKIQGKINPQFKAREERIRSNNKDLIKDLPGIYLIECLETGKVYVGQSSNVKLRIAGYKKGDKYINPILKKDIAQYGIAKFKFSILEYLEESTEDIRLDREAYYKSLYSQDRLYNLLVGREDSAGYERYKESLKTKELIL